jgi:hypothetical protein
MDRYSQVGQHEEWLGRQPGISRGEIRGGAGVTAGDPALAGAPWVSARK